MFATDLVAEGIRYAQQKASAQSIDNVRFEAADLLDLDLSSGLGGEKFDYIDAHGFLAWTIPEVQQRVFEVCRDCLAPGGVAMISYNAMPGSMMRDALRRLLTLELTQLDGGAPADEQLRAADAILKFFESVLPDLPTLPHGKLLESTIEAIRKQNPTVLLHDECGVESEPSTCCSSRIADWCHPLCVDRFCIGLVACLSGTSPAPRHPVQETAAGHFNAPRLESQLERRH